MSKSKKMTGAAVVAPSLPENKLPDSGKVWITLFSDNKLHEVSAQLAKTLINKNVAKLKEK